MGYSFIQEIEIDSSDSTPLYIQLANDLSSLIRRGILKPGYKLPGTRKLAELLNLNRNTVISGLHEMTMEGWLVSKPKSGFYVNEDLPIQKIQTGKNGIIKCYPAKTNFFLKKRPIISHTYSYGNKLEFNDGFPDIRLAPLRELQMEYTSLFKSTLARSLLTYGDPQGDYKLREQLSSHLNYHRGLKTTPDQIMLTRGSLMGIYILAQILIENQDYVVIEKPGYLRVYQSFQNAKANILEVPVDENGLQTDILEKLIKKYPVKAVYVTSHHQYPTTVALCPDRRQHLLSLAKTHKFALIEDDYDFEFHHENKPLLPIASADDSGSVIYIGSFSKTLFPATRTGFVVAPQNLIQEMVKVRMLIDRQGDPVMERAIGRLIANGVYDRYIRKSLQIYLKRKDHLSAVLREQFSDVVTFKEPEGGLAFWVQFNKAYPLKKICAKSKEQGLFIEEESRYNPEGENLNSTRLGFASMNNDEIDQAAKVLRTIINNIIT